VKKETAFPSESRLPGRRGERGPKGSQSSLSQHNERRERVATEKKRGEAPLQWATTEKRSKKRKHQSLFREIRKKHISTLVKGKLTFFGEGEGTVEYQKSKR